MVVKIITDQVYVSGKIKEKTVGCLTVRLHWSTTSCVTTGSTTILQSSRPYWCPASRKTTRFTSGTSGMIQGIFFSLDGVVNNGTRLGLPIVLKVSKVLKGLSLEKIHDFLHKTFKTFKTLILPTFY